jgi:small subunit ribosomal protein S6
MREYELTYLISDNVPEADLNKVTGKVGGYVSSLGGKILKEEIWGRRKLAYPIKKQEFATYVTLNFSLPAEKANELEHNIFLSSKIIRHLMIVQDYGTEELTLSAEDVAETEEITKVIGGEKSFEAVVGETEESKELMAVRGEEPEAEEAIVVEEKTRKKLPPPKKKLLRKLKMLQM